MSKQDVIAGLDIGSAQVAVVIGRRDAHTGQIEVLSGARSACPGGLKGGVVINIDETARAVTRICEESEDTAKEMVKDLTIAVRGTHLQTFNNHGALNIARTDKEITAEDVEKAIESAQAVHMSADREIIHTIPQGFTLDRQQGVPNPVGMEGSLLEVDVHIVTASRSHLNNIFKAINLAGFSVTEPIYGLLGAGEVVVTQEERDLGSLLVDIGGQTTDFAVYFDGSMHFTEKLPLGADAITRDLAYGLRTSLSQAQQIKENYGVAMTNMLEQNEAEVSFTARGNGMVEVNFLYAAKGVKEAHVVLVDVKSDGLNKRYPAVDTISAKLFANVPRGEVITVKVSASPGIAKPTSNNILKIC